MLHQIHLDYDHASACELRRFCAHGQLIVHGMEAATTKQVTELFGVVCMRLRIVGVMTGGQLVDGKQASRPGLNVHTQVAHFNV